jgi:hypothetical protein
MSMLKIQRISEEGGTRLLLSGELRCGQIEKVRIEIAGATGPVTLDLQEVGLIDIDGIRLLNECQTQGTKVKNAAPYAEPDSVVLRTRRSIASEQIVQDCERRKPERVAPSTAEPRIKLGGEQPRRPRDKIDPHNTARQ